MVDVVSKEKRSEMMAGIKSRNTKPELAVRQFLHSQGYRFRLHNKTLPGKPDLALKKFNAVVFIHGCYWHQHENCKLASTPKQNTEFWENKFNSNKKRDSIVLHKLKTKGIRTAVIWECGIRNKSVFEKNMYQLIKWLKSDIDYIVIPTPQEISDIIQT